MPSRPPSPCLGCGALVRTARCPDCERAREAGRGSAVARGYDQAHAAARRALARTLPAPCAYCGDIIEPSEPWHAAHKRDGQPEYGWQVSHGHCNRRARRR